MEIFNTNLNLVEVTYICNDTYETANDTALVNGRGFARAIEDIEAYYGNTIVSVKITPLEVGPYFLTPEMAGAIKSGCGLA
jgi:hypothetical protein